jgi:putative transposase
MCSKCAILNRKQITWQERGAMAKATTTIRQILNYKPTSSAWFAATQTLFNQVAAFYFSVIQAHERVLELGNQEALTALEQLTHQTRNNPNPVMPLSEVAEDIPAMFRRAAIHAALGSARSFSAHLKTWRARKEKALAKGKQFTERPPVPPRSWNKSATIYAGQWKERSASSIMLKVWTGTCWSWVKCRITGRALPEDAALGSPQLVKHGTAWWLHTPVERQFRSPAKVEEQITANSQTNICAVDLNLDGAIAVCSIQTAEGSTIATRFIGGGERNPALGSSSLAGLHATAHRPAYSPRVNKITLPSGARSISVTRILPTRSALALCS